MPDDESPEARGRRQSAGGAAAASGVGLDALLLAWLSSHLLSGAPLPDPWRFAEGRLTSVGGQTGAQMDDAGGITIGGGRLYVQTKRGLELGTTDASPLAEAIDQAARQFRAGVEDDDGLDLGEHRDLLAIITDRGASGPVKEHLTEIVRALSTLPPERSFEAVAVNNERKSILDTLLAHTRRSLAAAYGVDEIEDETVRAFFRVLFIGVLELDSGQGDRRAAEALLAPVLVDPEQRYGVFDELASDALEESIHRTWKRAVDLRAFLRSRDFALRDDPRHSTAINRLRTATTDLLAAQAAELLIEAPDGTVRIDRRVADLLDSPPGAIALTGDAGSGKSAAAVNLAIRLREAGHDVVYLTADSFRPDVAAVRGLDFTEPLAEVFASWDGDEQATLIVDGLDATRGTSNDGWVLALLPNLENTRWRTIATFRTYDLRNGLEWRRAFRGEAVDPPTAISSLADVRHLAVGDLNDDELDQVRAQSASLADLLDGADERLLALLRNPFNLNMAAALLRSGNSELGAMRSRLDLLDAYWRTRVSEVEGGLTRSAAARALTDRLVGQRRTSIDVLNAVEPSQLDAVESLLHDGVLRELRSAYSGARIVEYSHPLLFDYAVSAALLFSADPLELAARLDADPNLVIRLWPSVDLHLSSIWQLSVAHEQFWALALHLAMRPNGHPLAGIAAASVSLRSSSVVNDFAPLLSALIGPQRGLALRCLNHISGVLISQEIPSATRLASLECMSDVAAAVAEIAREQGDFSIADGGLVLLRRLQDVSPLDVGTPGALPRSLAADALTRFALADPAAPHRIDVARMVVEMLAAGTLIDPERCAPTLEATLAPGVLTKWGVLGMRSALSYVPRIAGSLPQLAAKLFETPWTFEETRDEGVGFGSLALGGLVTSWKGLLDTTRSDTPRVFPSFLEAAPLEAARALAKVAEFHPSGRIYPYLYTSDEPTPHDQPVRKMTKQLGAWLKSTANDLARYEPVLDMLAAGDRSGPDLWQALFSAGASHPETLGRAIILRVSADTFDPMSVTLAPYVAAMSTELTGSDHERLERLILGVDAPDPDDADRTARMIKYLISNLDPDHVQLDASRELLPDPAAEASVPSPPSYGWADGATPTPEESDDSTPELQALRADTQAATNPAGAESARIDAATRVRGAFLGALRDHAGDPEVLGKLSEPALLLARTTEELTPESEIGRAVLQALLRALDGAP